MSQSLSLDELLPKGIEMAWMITLISGVHIGNNNLVGCIEDEGAADEVGALLLEIYNREFPEYSHYLLSELRDGPSDRSTADNTESHLDS